jgi:hypothetical protein
LEVSFFPFFVHARLKSSSQPLFAPRPHSDRKHLKGQQPAAIRAPAAFRQKAPDSHCQVLSAFSLFTQFPEI